MIYSLSILLFCILVTALAWDWRKVVSTTTINQVIHHRQKQDTSDHEMQNINALRRSLSSRSKENKWFDKLKASLLTEDDRDFKAKSKQQNSATNNQVTLQTSPRNPQFIREAVKVIGPSVVRIDCEREVNSFMSLFSPPGHMPKETETVRVSGTGIVASADGFILTNAHVVEDAKKLIITLSNGRSFRANLIASDELTDLAVIKVDLSKEKSDFKLVEAPLGDSSDLCAGDWVVAVGCPVGLDFTVTMGVISSPRRSAYQVGAPHLKGSYIQTDAALNSGNSGGPLVNEHGEVVGINTMVRLNTEAIGFAIPINRATAIYNTLKDGRKPSHAFFGLEAVSITPDKARISNEDPNSQRIPEVRGALVTKVLPDSPADRAGLRRNDVIVAINGQSIESADDAETYLDECSPGKVAQLRVARGDGNHHTINHAAGNGNTFELSATPADLHQMIFEKKRQMQQPAVVFKP